MSPMQHTPRNPSHDDVSLAEFRALCAKARQEGRQLRDQDKLDVDFLACERRPTPEYYRELLRHEVRTAPKRKAPPAAAEQLAKEFAEAGGHDFSASQVALGDIFSRATRTGR